MVPVADCARTGLLQAIHAPPPATALGPGDYEAFLVSDLDVFVDGDLFVTDDHNDALGEDTATDPDAAVTFSINRRQQVRFKVRAYALQRGLEAGYYGLVIVRRGV